MLDQFELVGRALSDPGRVRILKLLEGGELCVCQVTAVMALAPATVSKHLSILRVAGLVGHRKEGRWVYYRLGDGGRNPYAAAALAMVRAVPADDPAVAADRARLARVAEVPLAELCSPGFAVQPAPATSPGDHP